MFKSLNCSGSETSLFNCQQLTSTCSHSEDVGLSCQGKLLLARIMLQVAALTVLLTASGESSCPHIIGVNMFVIDTSLVKYIP